MTIPTTRFKVLALALLAILAAILAQTSVNTTHNTRQRISGIPPTTKWLTPPVKAVNAIINTLVPTAKCIGYPRKEVRTRSSIIPPPAPAKPQINPTNIPPTIALISLLLGELSSSCSLVLLTGFKRKRKPIIMSAICIVPLIACSGKKLATKLPIIVTTNTLTSKGKLFFYI